MAELPDVVGSAAGGRVGWFGESDGAPLHTSLEIGVAFLRDGAVRVAVAGVANVLAEALVVVQPRAYVL